MRTEPLLKKKKKRKLQVDCNQKINTFFCVMTKDVI